MLRISAVYCCNATLTIISRNEFSLEHGCCFSFDGKFSLILICVDCLKYFKSQFQAPNFCLEEFKKCLLEKYLGKTKAETSN